MTTSSLPSVSNGNRAFTVIELMIVVGIIAILASMAMPVFSVAQRAAKKTATQSIMHKLDTALHLFRADIGSFPYQRSYADISAGDKPSNRLAFHLSATLGPAELLKLHSDADAAAEQYAYDCSNGNNRPKQNALVSAHVFRTSDVRANWTYKKVAIGVWDWVADHGGSLTQLPACVMLNRMAAERARLAIWAGNVDVVGCKIPDEQHPLGGMYRAGRDNSGQELLATVVKQSDASPGWADDYLAGELEARYRDGDTVLDAWKRPIIYIGQVVEGVKGSGGIIFHEYLRGIDAPKYGLGTLGRKTLAAIDSLTGQATQADAVTLPDVDNLMNSDRRYWAAPGLENSFELWSAGPDGRFDWMRNVYGNADNVSLSPYDQSIGR